MKRTDPAGGLPGRVLEIEQLSAGEACSAFSYFKRQDRRADTKARNTISVAYEDDMLACQRFTFETWVPIAWSDIISFPPWKEGESRAHVRFKLATLIFADLLGLDVQRECLPLTENSIEAEKETEFDWIYSPEHLEDDSAPAGVADVSIQTQSKPVYGEVGYSTARKLFDYRIGRKTSLYIVAPYAGAEFVRDDHMHRYRFYVFYEPAGDRSKFKQRKTDITKAL